MPATPLQPIRFGELSQSEPGTLSRLLRAAYAALLQGEEADFWMRESVRWDAFDRDAFALPPIGRCVFLTWSGEQLAGFGSFDPRGAPESAIVGHNCVQPEFQGFGIGRLQLAEIVRRTAALNVRRLRVSTLDTPFFLPARRMYERAGFALVEKAAWPARQTSQLLRYELAVPLPTQARP